MSFAKNQEEEVASVPGVAYTDTTSRNDANRDMSTPAGTDQSNRDGARDNSCATAMGVEMGWMGESRARLEPLSTESDGGEGERSAFV